MKVKSNAPHVFQMIVPELRLMPGVQYVPDNVKEAFLNDIHVKARIASGLLEILDEDVKDVKDAKKDYKTLMKDIPQILDIKLLQQMKVDEARPSVLKAIDDQIAKMREGRVETDKVDAE
jgi:hypothetical protein